MSRTIIEESKWYRGEGGNDSRLLREDGRMCCLGFDALRRGFTPEEIIGTSVPCRLSCDSDDPRIQGLIIPTPQEYSKMANSGITAKIVLTNDNTVLSDTARKERLTELFRELNTEVVFVP